MANDGICLDALEVFTANKNSSLARIVNCADTSRQIWSYDFNTQHIIQHASNNCLTASHDIQMAFAAASTRPKWSIAERRRNDISFSINNNNEMQSGIKESKFNVSTTPCTESKLQKWMLLPFAWN